MPEKYVHTLPGEEVSAIGGRYIVEKELRISVGGREALVVIGYMIIDKSCCGTGGCRYALVPGFLTGDEEHNADGALVSVVDPVPDEETQNKLSEIINSMEVVQQINFW